jgi:ribonuclease BN (tRNA processing enzyme)
VIAWRWLLCLLCLWPTYTIAGGCGEDGVFVQVLGSGGPELQDKRASSGYLIWASGKPRVLIDSGGGSALRFGESGADVKALDVILFTHLHVDHSADLPALIKSSWFERRRDVLPIYGPTGNKYMPSTVTFVRGLFDQRRGIYRYLGEFLSPLGKNTYKLKPYDVEVKTGKIVNVFSNSRLSTAAAGVKHGRLPALAWRVVVNGKTILFSGDMNGDSGALEKLAIGADLLIAHNAIPEKTTGAARALHMPPSVIGRIAHTAGVKQLVLSHRMLRTLGREEETMEWIKKSYSGPTTFADDLDCFKP